MLKDEGLRFLMKVMIKVLHISNCKKIHPFVPKIIVATQPFWTKTSPSRTKAADIVHSLSKTVGFDAIAAVIKLQMNDDSEHAARVTGTIASSQGIHIILPLIEDARQSKQL